MPKPQIPVEQRNKPPHLRNLRFDLQRRQVVSMAYVDQVRRLAQTFNRPFAQGVTRLPPPPPAPPAVPRRAPIPDRPGVLHWMDLLANHALDWVSSTAPPPPSVDTTREATSSTQLCTPSLTEVQSIPLPPTPSVSPHHPSLFHTEEELAERVMASGKPECWSPALTAALRALRPPGTAPNKRLRRRLTDRHGRQIRIALPTGQSIPSNP